MSLAFLSLTQIVLVSLIAQGAKAAPIPDPEQKAIRIINRLNEDQAFFDARTLFTINRSDRNKERVIREFYRIVGQDTDPQFIETLKKEFEIPEGN
jgi:hypothetical protein